MTRSRDVTDRFSLLFLAAIVVLITLGAASVATGPVPLTLAH